MAERLGNAFPGEHYHTSYSDIFHRSTVAFKLDDAATLTHIATWLRINGYQIHKVDDSPAQKLREYQYIPVGAGKYEHHWGAIVVAAHFQEGDDARCKYVQIDTKHVPAQEEPVYELQCDDEPIAVPEPVGKS